MASENAWDDEQFSVKGPPPPDGYTYLYNDAASVLMTQHGTVIKTYLALCLMSNGQRKCHPSLEGIGKEIGVSRETAKRAVATLEDLGILKIQRPETPGRGRASVYYLTRPDAPEKGVIAGDPNTERIGVIQNTKRGQTETEKGSPAMTPQQETSVNKKQEQENNGAPPISDQEKNGARPEGAQTKVPVSTSKHTYWTHPEWGPQREFCFTTIQGFYPRDDGEQSARHAWERRIGTRLDVPDLDQEMFWKALCYASQWYRDEVKRNATEAKYITSFPNWLAGEKWNDAPRWVREGKAGPDAR